jgi:hypothetical protein
MKRGLPSSTEVLRGDTPEYVSVSREEYEALKERVLTLEDLLHAALPSLGMNPRSYAQMTLFEACELLGSDAADWSRYPEVLEQAKAAA